MSISVSIYQVQYLKTTFKQRYWKERIDDIKQRYWKKVTKERAIIRYRAKRFDFWGSKQEVKDVVDKCLKEGWIPKKRFIRGSAKGFLKHPEKYGYRVR